jgi:hypothetical protein
MFRDMVICLNHTSTCTQEFKKDITLAYQDVRVSEHERKTIYKEQKHDLTTVSDSEITEMWQNGKVKVSRGRKVKLVSRIGDVKMVKAGVNQWVHVPKKCCLPPQLTPAPGLVIPEVLTEMTLPARSSQDVENEEGKEG